MAQDPSASAAAASLPLSHLEDLSLLDYVVPEMCYNTTLIHSTIGLQASASGIKDVTDSLDEYMCICMKNTGKEPAVFCHNTLSFVIMDSDECFARGLNKLEFERNFKAYKNRDMLCVCPLTTERDGTYCVQKGGKTSKFKKYRKQAEAMEICEVQNCLHESCSCCMIYPSLVESPMPQVKKSFRKELELLNCTGDNVVRNKSKTVTTPRVLPNANATDPPSTGTSSNVAVAVGVTGSFVLLLFFLVLFYKYGVTWMKGRCRGSAGSQDDSHGAAGDMDTQAESV